MRRRPGRKSKSRRYVARALSVCTVVAIAVSSCAVGNAYRNEPSTTQPTPEHPPRYVAIGASDTVGSGADDPATQAWPKLVYDTLPAGTEYRNLGISGATVSVAIVDELPEALEADADVISVWLNANDIIVGVSADDYEDRLDMLIAALRTNPDQQILIANTPQLSSLPVFDVCWDDLTYEECPLPDDIQTRAELDAIVGRHNEAIRRVAARHSAVVVDLNASTIEASLIDEDGFHPSTRGHATIAEQFVDQLDR